MEEKADFLIERTQSFPHSATISQQSKVASVKGLPATREAKQNRKKYLCVNRRDWQDTNILRGNKWVCNGYEKDTSA